MVQEVPGRMAQGVSIEPHIGPMGPKVGLEEPRVRQEPALYRSLQGPEEHPAGVRQVTYGTAQWL